MAEIGKARTSCTSTHLVAWLTNKAVQIVDDDYASPGHPNEIKQWLPADHLSMCMFDIRASVAYRIVSGATPAASLADGGRY